MRLLLVQPTAEARARRKRGAMSEQWEEQVDEFEAVADNGEHYRIQEWVGMIDLTEAGSEVKRSGRTGSKRYCTSAGLACNRIDDRTFEIVALGLNVGRVAASS